MLSLPGYLVVHASAELVSDFGIVRNLPANGQIFTVNATPTIQMLASEPARMTAEVAPTNILFGFGA